MVHPVERASPDDAAELVQLRDRLATWLQARGVAQWRPGEVGLDRVRAWIERGAVDLCRGDGGIDAAVAVLWDDPVWAGRDRDDAGYVHLLLVDRRRAGQGLGDVMLAHAEQRIRQAGRVRVRLDAVTSNSVLRQWYQRRGYRPVGTVQFDREDLFDTTLFEKRLPLLPGGRPGAIGPGSRDGP